MVSQLGLMDCIEIYSLGILKRPNTLQRDVPIPKEAFIYYTRRQDYKWKDKLMEERVCAFMPDGKQYLDDHLQIRFNQHPLLMANRNYEICSVTFRNRSIEKYMLIPPAALSDQTTIYKKVPFDLSRWDDDILRLCLGLPVHVKRVMSL